MYGINHSFISRYGRRNSKYPAGYASDRPEYDNVLSHLRTLEQIEAEERRLSNLNAGQKRKMVLSNASVKKIRNRVFFMSTIAEEKQRFTANKKLVKYKLCFLTLTISGDVVGGIKEANKKLLNTLLTDLRRNVGMKNYVWRLELQKNGKIHYHIVTDASVSYKYLRHVWNRIQLEQGYMKSFTEKFSNMDFNQYSEYMKSQGYKNMRVEKLPEWFAKGKREKWENPNSVDVAYVNNEKSVSAYISKYITKPPAGVEDQDENDVELSGRIWGSSAELAETENIKHEFQDVAEFAYFAMIQYFGAKEHDVEFATFVLVSWDILFSAYPWMKPELRIRLRRYAKLEPSKPPTVGILSFT